MITLTPAYGRDYKSLKAVQEDIKANKDFIMIDFLKETYCSPIDLKGQKVQVRYDKLRKVAIVQL